MNQPFKIFGQIDIQKSLASDPFNGFVIKGKVLRQVKDAQGETPIMDKMDWSYFDKTGNVLYEHTPATTTIDKSKGIISITPNIPPPSNYIGKAIKRYSSKDGKEEYVDVALFPENQKAQDIIKMMKSIDAVNKKFGKKQNIGFSIEAIPINKSAKGYADRNGNYAGTVVSIVISPTPQDTGAIAELADHNEIIAKALSAGYDVNPSTMEDGATLKKESLIKNPKSTTIKERKMRKYKSVQDAFSECITKGMKPAEAQTEAKKLWAEQQDAEHNETIGTIQKSVDAGIAFIKKSIEPVTAFLARVPDVQKEIAISAATIQKSMVQYEVATEANPFDGGQAVIEISKSVQSLRSDTFDANQVIAKGIAANSEAIQELFGILKSMATQIAINQQTADDTINRVTGVALGLKQSIGGVTDNPAILKSLSVPGDTKTAPDENVRILKSIPPKRIESYLVDKGASLAGTPTAQIYFNAQSAFKVQGAAGISKSLQVELVEALAQFSHAN